MKDKYQFPAIFSTKERWIAVYFPDFPKACATGSDENVYEHAKEALALYLYNMEQNGQSIPEPTPENKIQLKNNERVYLIEVSMADILKSEKLFDKLLTIPESMQEIAKKRPDIKAAHDELEPRYNIIRALKNRRLSIGMSQKELAKKMGTEQSNISRFESGDYNPSVDFLTRMAMALGKNLNITLE